MAESVEARLRTEGYELPDAPAAVGSYVPVLRTGNLIVTSGQLPFAGGELVSTGKVGSDLTEQQGSDAGVICVLNALAHVKSAAGSLDNVTRIVRLEGFVQSASGFNGQPGVINAASELLAAIFGEIGRHTRAAIGANELPLNAPVELSLWAEVAD